MLYYITLLIIFIVIACAGIILFRKFAYIRQRNKELQKKRESEFMNYLVAEGELKPDQWSQLGNLIENNAIDEMLSKLKETGSLLDFIFKIMNSLSDEEMRQFLKELEKRQTRERRKYHRKDFFRVIDYNVGDQHYRDFIQDLSVSGVFIKTGHTFSAGQSVFMTLMSPAYQKPFKIIGEIIRVHTDGIGVKFKIESQVQEAVLKNLVDLIKN